MTRIQSWFQPIDELARATDEIRERVVRALAEYIELSTRMRTFEDVFRTRKYSVIPWGGWFRSVV